MSVNVNKLDALAKAIGAQVVGGQMIALVDGKHEDLGRFDATGAFVPTPKCEELLAQHAAGELAGAIASADPFDHDGDGKPGGAPKGGNKRRGRKAPPAPPAPPAPEAQPEPAPPAPAPAADAEVEEVVEEPVHDVVVADEEVQIEEAPEVSLDDAGAAADDGLQAVADLLEGDD